MSKNVFNRSSATLDDPLTIGRLNVTTLSEVDTINGVIYPPPVLASDTSNWALFPASGNLDMNNNIISNVQQMTVNNTIQCFSLNVSGLTTLPRLSVSQYTTLSGVTAGYLNVSGLTTLSGLSVSQYSTLSGVTAGYLNVSELTTLSAAKIINNLSVGTINGVAYPGAGTTVSYAIFGTGVIKVDQCGNNTLGASSKYLYPFKDVSEAIAVATSGDEIMIFPGTYPVSNVTIPVGVTLRGANTQSTFLTCLNATISTDMFTLLSNSRIEDLTLRLTSSTTLVSNAQYSIIKIQGSNIPSLKIRTCVLQGSNLNPGGNIYGLHSAVNDTAINTYVPISATTVRACTIDITTSGTRSSNLGIDAHCIYSSGSNRLSTRDTNCYIYGVNCTGGRIIACESTTSGGYLDLQTSTICASGSSITNCSLAEISQTHVNSVVTCGYTNLINHNANGFGFDITQTPPNFLYAAYEKGPGWGSITSAGFMYPGSVDRDIVYNTTSNEAIGYAVQQGAVMHGVSFRRNIGSTLTGGILYTKIYKNEAFTTQIFTLILICTVFTRTDDYNSVKLDLNDRIYVELSGSTGLSSSGLHSVMVDFGLF